MLFDEVCETDWLLFCSFNHSVLPGESIQEWLIQVIEVSTEWEICSIVTLGNDT
jgi:hypothetical protein